MKSHFELLSRGASKNLGNLPGIMFVKLDGEPYINMHGTLSVIPDSRYLNVFGERIEKAGDYATNNGAVAVVDHEGCLLVAPVTAAHIDVLEEAGYRRTGDIFVPLSNGEKLTRPHVQERIDAMWRAAKDISAKGQEDIFLKECEANARKNSFGGYLPGDLPADKFMEVDGLVYISNRFGPPSLASISLGKDDPHRAAAAGTYAMNNGIIAAVDTKGRVHVACTDQVTEERIRHAGYSRGSFFVPLSNSETPVGWSGQLDIGGKILRGGVDQNMIEKLGKILQIPMDGNSIEAYYKTRIEAQVLGHGPQGPVATP